MDKTEFQNRLEKLIETRETNSFKNHISRPLDGKSNLIRGEFDENGFTFWRTDHISSGTFYPIFQGRILEIKGSDVLEIKVRFNPVAEIMVIGIGLALGYFIITEIIIQQNNEFISLFIRTLASLVLFLILQSVPLYAYYDLKNQTLRGLVKYFDLTKVKIVGCSSNCRFVKKYYF